MPLLEILKIILMVVDVERKVFRAITVLTQYKLSTYSLQAQY